MLLSNLLCILIGVTEGFNFLKMKFFIENELSNKDYWGAMLNKISIAKTDKN